MVTQLIGQPFPPALLPEPRTFCPDDVHLDDGEVEEMFAAAGECAAANGVLERLCELGDDDGPALC